MNPGAKAAIQFIIPFALHQKASSSPSFDYDVAVIGGGPAGSAAAITLSRTGRRVAVIERDKFPRFKIGESLLPHSVEVLRRLGVLDRIAGGPFVVKHGAEVFTADGASGVRVYFKNALDAVAPTSFQVTRADFDQILLRHAAACGAEVFEQCTVAEVEAGADGAKLGLQPVGAAPRTLRARYVIDCSGRNAVLGTQWQLKRNHAQLRKFSVFAHYEDVQRNPGVDGTLTRMVRGTDCWFWLIPLSETRTSIGVVMEAAEFRSRRERPETALDRQIAAHPVMAERMAGARRVSPVWSAGDYSYRNLRLTGPCWLMAGDAAGFIDPVFSTGVFLALASGEDAALAVAAALDGGEGVRHAKFRAYARKINRAMDLYLGLVNRWYQPQFIELFVTPTTRFGISPAVNAVLSGTMDPRFRVRWRLRLFYLALWLQRFFPLRPRIKPDHPARTLEPTARPGPALTRC